jgi:hypothetical protein
VLLYAIILFIIIYFAVKLAINPLISKPGSPVENDQDFDLSKLHDIGLLSEEEFSRVIETYWNEESKKENNEYKKACKVLLELKDKGFFTTEEYNEKVEKLKEYYSIQG